MWSKWAYVLGSFYGFSGVILGAMGAHALKKTLSTSLLNSYQVGTRYQMYHALFILLLGVLLSKTSSRLLNVAVICATIGVIGFSGSIYALTVLRWKVGIVTPIGGVFLIAAWFLLMLFALRSSTEGTKGSKG